MLPANKPILCYVTDRRGLPAPSPSGPARTEGPEEEASLLSVVERAAAAGVDWIQVREKDLPGGRLAALLRNVLGRAARTARILVNDRLDVALATRAGGVHLGEESLSAEEVARWLRSEAGLAAAPADFLVGVSCHSVEASRGAEKAGARYVFFGPVFATPSKAAYGAPQGLERLREACAAVRIPVLAIGGITTENAAACLAAGAAGIAAIRLFQNAGDLSSVVAWLRKSVSSPSV